MFPRARLSPATKSFLACAIAFATCAWKQPARESKAPPPPAPSPFVLGQATPLPIAKLSLVELKGYFPAFAPVPATNEYNHLVLPFSGGPTEADQNKAYAFSFLLSNALDWGPGCYCSRHAYFTFKRSGLAAIEAGKTLRPTAIRALAGRWESTHAIGGEIQATPAGFTGVLKIFAADGSLLNTIRYDTPRPYFTLLGDMSVDSLTTLGWRPPPSLGDHLRLPRCKNEALLADLGRAAFAGERSEEEFGIYRKILEEEPGFAEVRYWWANQSLWAGGNSQTYSAETARSVRSYLTRTALEDADCQSISRDAGLDLPALEEKIASFCGPDSPVTWRLRLRNRVPPQAPPSLEEARAATAAAARYPNNFKLLLVLSAPDENGPWREDASMVAGIALAVMECRKLPSSHTWDAAAYDLANAAKRLGYDHIAAELLTPLAAMAMRQQNTSDFCIYGDRLAKILQDMGQYEDSFALEKQVIEAGDEGNRPYYLLEAAISGLILGKTNEVERLAKKWGSCLSSKPGTEKLLHAYLALARGDSGPALAVIREEGFGREDMRFRLGLQRLILYTQVDFLRGTSEFRETTRAAHCLFPEIRPLWILLDAYDRRDPRPEDEGFYEALGHGRTYDPWVREAMNERARRVSKPRLFNLERTLSSLDTYKIPAWPVQQCARYGSGPEDPFVSTPRWEYTYAIYKLLDMREYDRADEFARQCLAMNIGPHCLTGHFNHLYHLVQGARRADPAPPARTMPPPTPPKATRQWGWPAGMTNLTPELARMFAGMSNLPPDLASMLAGMTNPPPGVSNCPPVKPAIPGKKESVAPLIPRPRP